MSDTLSLKELKAQNETEEQIEVVEPVQDEYIEVDPETDEPVEPEAVVEEEEEESEDEQTETLEAWQQSEGEESEDGKSFVADAGWKTQRLKTKALKADIREKDDKLDEMQAKIDALTLNRSQPIVEQELPPTLEESDFDEAKHQVAMMEFYDKRMDSKINRTTQTLQQSRQAEQAAKLQNESVDKHYDRAANLIESKAITEDNWIQADKAIYSMLDEVSQGQGRQYADQLIATLNNSGDGSEKVWYYLGKNPSELAKLRTAFERDPSGIQSAMFLGQLQQKATKPIKQKRSEAPKPAANLKGDVSIKASKAQKAYDKMTDPGERIKYKRKMKASGNDVSKW